MNFFSTIQQFITQHTLVNHNDTIIIGLSGGPDSVFLLHLLVQLHKHYNLTLIAAHLNHEWRPEADQEEELCRTIAQKNGISFITAKLSQLPHTAKNNGSKEDYARTMRRFFLEQVAHEHGAQKIALGHHAQDQQETFFIRLIRGASLTGLTAMKPLNGLYIRPLLTTNKSDILQWLNDNQITYAIDGSNKSPLYLRNRIRNTVLPALQECDTRFNDNFFNTLNRLQETERFLEKMTHESFTKISCNKNGAITINTALLATVDSALHHRIIMHWLIAANVTFPTTQSFFDELLRFLLSPRGGTHSIHPQWSIVKKQGNAIISSLASTLAI
jgi:tRNA(Ile)-lysidine synthase